MILKAFGKLRLETANESINKPYIALLALIYLKIEGATNRKTLAYYLQAGAAGKLRPKKRKKNKKEVDDTALAQFNTNITRDKRIKTFFGSYKKDNPIIEIVGELACDVTDFEKLLQGDTTDLQKAIAIYEHSTGFLSDFEQEYNKGKLKPHYKKALEIRNWVKKQRAKFDGMYREAKAKLTKTSGNQEAILGIDITELKKQLPEKGYITSDIDARDIIKYYVINPKSIKNKKSNNYIEEYIKVHIDNYESSSELELETFKVLLAMVLLEPGSSDIIKKSLDISNEDYNLILEDLTIHYWIESDIDNLENTDFIAPKVKTIILNYLKNNQKDYLDIVIKMLPETNNSQKFSLLNNLLRNKISKNSLKRLEPFTSDLCHALINQQEPHKAIKLSTMVIKNLKGKSLHAIHFWHAYALVRNRQYGIAQDFLEQIINYSDKSSNKEYYYRLISLKSVVLEENKGDIEEIKKLCHKAINSKSDWARAEAYNVLGKLYFRLYGINKISEAETFLKKSIYLWQEIKGEETRHFGTISNLITLKEKLDFRKAIDEYSHWIAIAAKDKWNNSTRLRLILNQSMFYRDLISDRKKKYHLSQLEITELNQKIKQNLKLLRKAVENKNLDNEVKTTLIYGLGIYYFDTENLKLAKEHFKLAFEKASKYELERLKNAAQIAIGELDENLDIIELAMHRLMLSNNNIAINKSLIIYNDVVNQLIQSHETIKKPLEIKNLKIRQEKFLSQIEIYFNTY